MLFIVETIFKTLNPYRNLLYLFLFCFVSTTLFPVVAGGEETAVIIADGLRVRSGPGVEYEAFASLLKGDRVIVAKRHDRWIEVYIGENTGFISGDERFVTVIKTDDVETPKLIKRKAVDPSKTKKVLSEQAEDIERTIQNRQREIRRFENAEKDVLLELDGLDRRINKLRLDIKGLKREINAVELRIGVLEEDVEELEKKIEQDKGYVQKRLAAYYKFGNLGMIELLLGAKDVFDIIHRKGMLERILHHDDKRLTALSENLALLKDRVSVLDQKKNEKLNLEKAYHQNEKKLSLEREKRELILSDIKEVKSIQQRAIAYLQKTREELDLMISEIEAEEAARKKKELDGKAFSRFKGLLNLPVNGSIISRYGPVKNGNSSMLTFNAGIEISAGRGEPVRAVMDGVVKHSGWLKGYGNLIIIDHGAHYHSVYAHAEEIFKQTGQRVEKDEVIAIVGDGGSLTGPKLYFEIRHYGKSIDPLLWISENDKEQS